MSKNLIIGIDEAGLGPRLGPLVISLNLFRFDDPSQGPSFEKVMEKALADDAKVEDKELRVCDSKVLYRGGTGFEHLEKTALSFWYACFGKMPATLGDWIEAACPELQEMLDECPWFGPDPLSLALPHVIRPEVVERSAKNLMRVMEQGKVEHSTIRQKILTAPTLNRMIDRLELKSEALMEALFSMLISALEDHPADRACIEIDKLGGRNFYTNPLQRFFHFTQIQPLTEGRKESSYAFSWNGEKVDLRFLCKGDSLRFHIALSSIMSKYIRELFMHLLNRFWRNWLPKLRPTAGYPVDAARFLEEVTPTAREHGLDPDRFTRIK